MLTASWEKLDKFFVLLSIVLILMTVLVIYTFKTLFTVYLTAFEVDPKAVAGEVKVNKQRLDEAYTWTFNKEGTKLNIIQ